MFIGKKYNTGPSEKQPWYAGFWEKMPDNEAIVLSEQLQLLQSLDDKIRFVYENASDLYLDRIEKRVINGKEYFFGIDGRYKKEALNFLFNAREKHLVAEMVLSDFEARIEKCETVEEQIQQIAFETDFLDNIIQTVKNSADKDHKLFYRAYNDTLRGKEVQDYEFEYDRDTWEAGFGHATALLRKRIIGLKKELESGEPAPTVEGPRAQVLLLFELGILEHLRVEYGQLKDDDFGRLLTMITGEQNSKQLAKEAKAVLANQKTSGKGGNPINEKSVRPIVSKLAMLGIRKKRLPDFD